MNAVPDNIAEKAGDIQSRHRQVVERVRGDNNLSAQGRLKQLARARLDALAEMTKLREGFDGKEAKTASDLSVDLFGAVSLVGADAISARDAADRARQIRSPREALELLALAENNGDQVLARAIGHRAFNEQRQPIGGAAWSPVLDAFTARRPETASKLAELAQARRRSVEQSVGRSVIFSLPAPRELERVSETRLQALADGSAEVGGLRD
jgi:hypothetical protein